MFKNTTFKTLLSATLFLFLVMPVAGALAQTGTITGTVSDSTSGETIPGANVLVAGTQMGTPTNGDGEFTISGVPVGDQLLQVTFIGFRPKEVPVEVEAGINDVDIEVAPASVALEDVVVTALGIERGERALSYSSQEVDAKKLNVTQDVNIKSSLAGKVAGVQINGQAGSKLGSSGNIRIRGALSLTSATSSPLYVIDGIPVGDDANLVNMSSVKSVNVLKGPNATALYGQRGENGVVIITTKTGADAGGVNVEFSNSTTFDNVAYLPNFQNEYGQGYTGESEFYTFNYDPAEDPEYFEELDGMKYIQNAYSDESWGPKLDGDEYAPWYAWFPDSPYYGETEKWDANPDNVRNFYDTGMTTNSTLAVSYAADEYAARVSYSNQRQNGLLPSTSLNKHFLSGRFNYDVSKAFNVGATVNYTLEDVNGDVYSDGYGNQTSGSFNNWFGRQIDISKLQELSDLRTPEGYQTSWNWWGPRSVLGPYGSTAFGDGLKKPAFWYNPYSFQDEYDIDRGFDDLLLNMKASYDLAEDWTATATASHTRDMYNRRYEFPYSLSNSAAPSLFNEWVNAFGEYRSESTEYNFDGVVSYQNTFAEDWTVEGLGGGTIRDQNYSRFSADMDLGNSNSGGLIIPDVYQYSNSREQIVPVETNWEKRVYSAFTRATVGYRDLVYLEGSYRKDWSSALPEGNNGYGYPSLGLSFVFSELTATDWLSYGKVRANWAQVGDDVGAEAILQSFALSNNPYSNPVTGQATPLLFTDNTRVDPNIQPALNTSFETGFDIRFLDNRIGLDATYYNEKREDEIIGIALSRANGAESFLTNAGSTRRQGLELSLDLTPLQTSDFRWDMTANWATNQTIVTDLPQDLETYEIGGTTAAFGFVNITHVLDEEWGQLRGAGIRRTDDGTPIFANPGNGAYAVEQNQNFGSVLPDWTGGLYNSFSFKGLSLATSFDFQKGGQFFSLSEQWGTYTGLLEETAGDNDKGNPKRDPVSEGGGVHITGETTDGSPVDRYVNAQAFYKQWYSNRLAEPFVHDASYLKLRELSLSYALPQKWLVGGVVKSASIGVVGRNLWLMAVSGDNEHGWDPSEFGETFGENGQLPGTRSYGFNVNVTL
jgi:TonB-linked SusC/RagA family outer membrane protein